MTLWPMPPSLISLKCPPRYSCKLSIQFAFLTKLSKTMVAAKYAPVPGRSWLPDGYSQIFRSYVSGPSGLKDYGSAMLCCKIGSLPFLGLRPHDLHPGTVQGKEGIKFFHLATLRVEIDLQSSSSSNSSTLHRAIICLVAPYLMIMQDWTWES